ncbi:PaaI family thioesterase [uncultured Sphingosinicella sp.]|uniref:PaaI family thioesterase n=1 Tax=uncultured Sphingosinicella sp. TaxID=478748 RepID=UPI0030D79F39
MEPASSAHKASHKRADAHFVRCGIAEFALERHGDDRPVAHFAAPRQCADMEETDDLANLARIRSSFAKQGLMRTLGATLGDISRGSVEISLSPSPAISQQHGFVHAGAISAVADTAAGYAALSTMAPGRGVLTTEFKINLLAPAVGDRFIARGKVLKAGKTLTLAQAEVFAEKDGALRLIAFLTATLMAIEGRDGITD